MQFSHVVVVAASFLSTLALANPVPISDSKVVLSTRTITAKRQAASIKASLDAAAADAIVLRDTFAAATGSTADVDTIRAQNTKLLATINAGTVVANNSPALSVVDAISLLSSISGLVDTVKDTLQTIVDKKSIVDSLGLTGEVHDDLVTQKAAVDTLGAAILAKLPASTHTLAQTYIDEIDAAFNDAITAYS